MWEILYIWLVSSFLPGDVIHTDPQNQQVGILPELYTTAVGSRAVRTS